MQGLGCLAPIKVVQQGPTACEVIGQATIVNGVEDTLIACLEDRFWHLRHKVELCIQVIPGGVAAQAPFAFHAIVEIRAFEHSEQSFHGHRDSGLLNKPDVEVKSIRRIAIKTEDKSTHDLQALRLECLDGMERILRVFFAHVLFLFGGDERGGSWCLNSHEY